MIEKNAGAMPRVGLVIVTFNAAEHIGRCLSAVANQRHRPDRIILIDNASSDGTLAAATAAAARAGLALEWITDGGNVGFAAANNRAVAALTDCDLVATLNPDAFPEPEWLAALVDAARAHPEAASYASKLLLASNPAKLDGVGDVFHVSGLAWRHGHQQSLTDVNDVDTPRPVFSACAAAALYRRDDWVRAGGFDERFFCYGEDVDLGFRLQLVNRTSWYVPGAVCLHVGSASSGRDSAFAIYHGHRNLEWAFLKNMPLLLLVRYLPLHLFASLATIGWFAVRGASGAIIRAKWHALVHVSAVLKQRRQIQATRTISDEKLLARLDRSPLLHRFHQRMRQAATSA